MCRERIHTVHHEMFTDRYGHLSMSPLERQPLKPTGSRGQDPNRSRLDQGHSGLKPTISPNQRALNQQAYISMDTGEKQ